MQDAEPRQLLPGGRKGRGTVATINGLGGISAYRPPARKAGAGAFRLPDGKETAAEVGGLAAVSMPGLLGLQEAQSDAVSDRDARRHAGEALETLRDLQLALLAGAGTDLARLERLTRAMPQAADPGLRAVQRALLLRVAVEGARHKAAASS